MNWRKVLGIISLCLVVGIGAKIIFVEGERFIAKSRDSEVKANFSALIIAQNAYYEEFGAYSSDLREVGYGPNGGLTFIFDKNRIPPKYLNILPQDRLPYLEKDKYRVLLIKNNRSNSKTEFWIMDESGKFEKLSL